MGTVACGTRLHPFFTRSHNGTPSGTLAKRFHDDGGLRVAVIELLASACAPTLPSGLSNSKLLRWVPGHTKGSGEVDHRSPDSLALTGGLIETVWKMTRGHAGRFPEIAPPPWPARRMISAGTRWL